MNQWKEMREYRKSDKAIQAPRRAGDSPCW